MDFGIRLLQLRTRLKFSQEDFATAIGVTSKAVQNWEGGKAIPDGKNLVEISSKFHVFVDELLFDSTERFSDEQFQKILPTKKEKTVNVMKRLLALNIQNAWRKAGTFNNINPKGLFGQQKELHGRITLTAICLSIPLSIKNHSVNGSVLKFVWILTDISIPAMYAL